MQLSSLSDTLGIICELVVGQGFKHKFANSLMTLLVEILSNEGVSS